MTVLCLLSQEQLLYVLPPPPQIQDQRIELAKLDAERAALSRLDKIRNDQGARATALEREAAASELRASLIEYNLEAVDAAIDAVNAGMKYDTIGVFQMPKTFSRPTTLLALLSMPTVGLLCSVKVSAGAVPRWFNDLHTADSEPCCPTLFV